MKMKAQTKIITSILMALILISMVSLTSAMVVKSVDYDKLLPGEETELTVRVENNLDDDYKDVSLSLDFSNVPLSPVGSSESTTDIDEGDSEDFNFKIKASSGATPGDYYILYVLKFENITKTGTIGVTISGNVDLSFSVSQDNPVINQKDKISLKIVNKGFADAKFATVRIVPSGFTLLSEEEIYIGTISSDDFETADFDVLLTSQSAILSVHIEYKDFENNLQKKDVNLPLTVYNMERALELGIITKSNTLTYVIVIIVLIVIWFIYRSFKKRAKRKKAEAAGR